MRFMLSGLIILIGAVFPISVRAQTAPPKTATATASEAELKAWITALGAREFEARDRAMQSLIAAGPVAIEPALQITTRGDHEVATRAVMVLKGIGEKGDIATLEAALAALGRIAESTTLPIGRRAAEVSERLESVRQDRAIEFFRSLGADVNPEFTDTWTSLFLAAPVFSVEFGPQWKGTKKDLERLKWLRDVEQVCLVGPKISDEWIRYLQDIPRLNSVKIKHAKISVKAVEELSRLERLRALRLQFVSLGDEMVPYLEKCDHLIRLVVVGRDLSADGERRLKERFNDGVDCLRGAMLGVTATQTEPWSISKVNPGSAADKAGLQADDRVLRYNDQAIETFPELKALISKSDPGDSATVDVQRPGVGTLQLKIVFGEWD